MWVKLTHYQYRMTLRVCALDEGIHDALTRETRPHKQIATNVEAPYAAWKFAAMSLRDVAYGPRGGRLSKAGVEISALKRITMELNFIDKHPALWGLALFGQHPLIVPAWKVEPSERDDRLYSPYPVPGHQFVILTPIIQNDQVRKHLTYWVEKPSGIGILTEEHVHLSLWRQRVR